MSSTGGSDEPTFSMAEVRHDMEEFERQAARAKCTYNRGYIKQRVYVCTTCNLNPENESNGASVKSGFCGGCRDVCHAGHDTLELYDKRDFRCDCGNGKLKNNPCQLEPAKDVENHKNEYNHNFDGKYCWCEGPDDGTTPMVMCFLCCDWFHTQHIKSGVPDDVLDDKDDFICCDCVSKHDFMFSLTSEHVVPIKIVVDGDSNSADATPGKKRPLEPSTGISDQDTNREAKEAKTGTNTAVHASKLVDQQNVADNRHNNSDGNGVRNTLCLRESRHKRAPVPFGHSLFLRQSWKVPTSVSDVKDGEEGGLCICDTCKGRYEAHGLSFLLRPEEEQVTEEMEGAVGDGDEGDAGESMYEQGMRALGTLPVPKQLDLLRGYSDMAVKLKEFLTEKARAGVTTIKKEDIQSFFATLGPGA